MSLTRPNLLFKAPQAAGYATGVFGKWHLSHGPAHDPTGFDEWRWRAGAGIRRYLATAFGDSGPVSGWPMIRRNRRTPTQAAKWSGQDQVAASVDHGQPRPNSRSGAIAWTTELYEGGRSTTVAETVSV